MRYPSQRGRRPPRHRRHDSSHELHNAPNRLGSRKQTPPGALQEEPRSIRAHQKANKPSSAGCVFLLGHRPQNQSREPETHQSHTAPTRFSSPLGRHSAQRGPPEQQQASVQQQPPPPRRAAALGSRSPERSAAANVGRDFSQPRRHVAASKRRDGRERNVNLADRVQPIVEQLRRAQCSRGLAAASAAAFASASRAKTTRAPAVTAPPLSSPTASARICGCACQPWRTLWTSAPSS